MKRKAFKFLIFTLITMIIIGCKPIGISEIDYSLNLNTEYKKCEMLENGNNSKAKVIILLGQSNASGCSIVECLKNNIDEDKFKEYEKGYDNVFINYCIDNHYSSSNGEFKKVDLTNGCGNGFFGPEVGMAEILNEYFQNEKVFILKYTMSGYSLNNHWLNNKKRYCIYDACIKFIKTYLDELKNHNYQVDLTSICWMQGESDTTIEKANQYYDNEVAFVNYLREDLKSYDNNQRLYFIDAGISNSPYCEPGFKIVNEAKERFAKLSELNIYFSTIDMGLTTLYEPEYEPDLGHYDSLSEIKLGNKFALELLKII